MPVTEGEDHVSEGLERGMVIAYTPSSKTIN